MRRWIESAAFYCVACAVLFGVVALVGNGLVLLGKAVGLW